ncbi:CCA tRNA nucleotidyltransferase [Capnocytophaga cynodegmi]|uniref:tRNA nucleotidyltransferase/poly(A) polymerase family protein n=1 Tax=Capnocytophaga cynodegmi TaxID=28189 RepID=A0A0B7HNG5_9FLAO|nr:HD domain-containing protein [Capnocytophaga cynodegmi]CEN35493.1 tRNA nucleotidyltransferase/poly(A) polymerase family protein [Capnocytophaga cynodegmi]CEN39482.1 tRNA nucleotidyltransferase/poly(A) polymerase family protein [Capnocytophaga cynodegmi]
MYHKEALSNPIFSLISKVSNEISLESYVIGGFVRDYLLKKKLPKDIDIVSIGSGIALAEKVAEKLPNNPKVSVFKNFGTAMIKADNLDIEFVGARKESYESNSRKPYVESGTLQDDQNRRDFTINAMALSISEHNFGELIDPFDGLSDLKNKIIRTPLDPDITYSDDPLRMMRAIRFATQLNFEIEKKSLQAIAKNKDRLKIISNERIVDELNKILSSPKPSIGLKLLYETKLLHYILPELVELQGVEEHEGQRHKDNFWHTLEVVDNIAQNTDDLWLRWSALLHDIGKAPTKRFDKKNGWTFHGHEFLGSKMVFHIFKRLRMPLNDKMKYVQKMVRMSSRPIIIAEDIVTDSAVRRLVFDAGDDFEDLMTLCEADITTKNPKKFKQYHDNFQLVRQKVVEVEEKDHIRNFQPPISGEEIMKTFNLKPSREIGTLKDAIKEAILDGKISNDYETAKKFMFDKAKQMKLI